MDTASYSLSMGVGPWLLPSLRNISTLFVSLGEKVTICRLTMMDSAVIWAASMN